MKENRAAHLYKVSNWFINAYVSLWKPMVEEYTRMKIELRSFRKTRLVKPDHGMVQVVRWMVVGGVQD